MIGRSYACGCEGEKHGTTFNRYNRLRLCNLALLQLGVCDDCRRANAGEAVVMELDSDTPYVTASQN
jgi:hypothetical protein